MKCLLSLFAFVLATTVTAQAQDGCYVEFSAPSVCSTRHYLMSQWENLTDQDLLSVFGFTLGTCYGSTRSLNKSLFDCFDSWGETIKGWQGTVDEYGVCAAEYENCETGFYAQAATIAKLRKTIRRLRKAAR